MKTDNVTFLLVEDDPGHASLIEKNLRRANIVNELVVVSDGEAALDFVFCRNAHSNRPKSLPLLVLLDLNLPVVDGYEVLRQLKSTEWTRRIPVVVLTTTSDEREINRCYDLGCNVFLSKPVDYDDFRAAVVNLGFLLSVVAVPDP